MRLFVLALVLLTAACQKSNEPSKSQAAVEKRTPNYFQVDPATAGNIEGQVRFEGRPPAGQKISMDAEEACQKLHSKPVVVQTVQKGKQNGLANVLVYVEKGLEGKTFAPPAQAVVLDQRGCQFVPRVIGLQTGQTFEVKNSDPVSHNVHPMPKNNRDWNQQQPPDAPDLKRRFGFPEVAIPVKCNIHAWMRSYIGVFPNPFFAVTDPDGRFRIANLPPGQYTVSTWHETLGPKTLEITVPERETVAADFRYH